MKMASEWLRIDSNPIFYLEKKNYIYTTNNKSNEERVIMLLLLLW